MRETDIIYQIDVDLGPLVIDASFRPESSPEDVEELYAVSDRSSWIGTDDAIIRHRSRKAAGAECGAMR